MNESRDDMIVGYTCFIGDRDAYRPADSKKWTGSSGRVINVAFQLMLAHLLADVMSRNRNETTYSGQAPLHLRVKSHA